MELMEQENKLHFEYWQFILSLITSSVLVVVFLYANFATQSELQEKENRDNKAISEIKDDIKEIKHDIKEILKSGKK